MNFQANYAPQGAPTTPRSDEPLYASVAGVAHGMGEGECAFQPRGGAETHVMTTQVLEALDVARPFLTLDEHAAAIAQRIPALRGQAEAVKRVLGGLAQRRLLVSDAELLATMKAAKARPLAPLAAVFIRACDRPAQLGALFDSLVPFESARGEKRRYVVLDDSRDADKRRANADAARAFAKASGAKVEHVDDAHWAAIAERIARARPAHATAVREAIARDANGKARFGGGKGCNLAALLGAGARYATLDEDFLLPLRAATDARSGIELRDTGELPATLFASVDAALEAGVALDRDPFDAQLAWCGQALGRVLSDDPSLASSRADLRGLEPSRRRDLDPATRIVATANGHRGSSGASLPQWLFMLEGEARAEFWRERETYLKQIDAANVWIGPARARLMPNGHFTPFIVDATTLLPPTLPTGRSEDLLFGALAGALDPSSAVLHSAWTMGHRQEARGGGMKRLFEPDTPGLAQYLADLVGSRVAELRAERPEQRVAGIVAWLEDLAAAPAATRLELLHEYLRFNRADLIARLQTAFAAAPAPPVWWQADVREMVTTNGRAIMNPGPPRLAGWDPLLDTDRCAERFSAELRGFAQVLAAWPALWEVAREQRETWLAS